MWTKTERIYKPETIISEISIDPYDMTGAIDRESLIKSRLLDGLFNNLTKYVRFENMSSFHDPYKKHYRAGITIVPSNITNVMHDDLVYKVKDTEFTHEQIEEAILNHFPEYFL